ncbi:MAG: hypothetical protein PHR94_14335 [Methylomonas lenta]|nr:hypothetical protein [Methylomonas lenta]
MAQYVGIEAFVVLGSRYYASNQTGLNFVGQKRILHMTDVQPYEH